MYLRIFNKAESTLPNNSVVVFAAINLTKATALIAVRKGTLCHHSYYEDFMKYY